MLRSSALRSSLPWWPSPALLNLALCLPGRGTAQPSFAIACLIERTKAEKLHLGLLFTDLKSAFYSTLPEVALGALLEPGERHALLTALGLTPDEIAAFAGAHLDAGSLLSQAGIAEPWVRAVRDWHQRTWFTVANGQRRCDTRSGTKPGDPLADAVFCFSFAVTVHTISAALQAAGLVLKVAAAGAGIFDSSGPEVEHTIPPLAYLDDLVFEIPGDDPAHLLRSLASGCDIVVATCRRFGFRLNFGAGKTEALIVSGGPGAVAMRASLAALECVCEDGVARPCIALADGTVLRVTASYKHLGVQQAPVGGLSRELAARGSSAAAACAALARPCLSNRLLPESARTHVAKACVLSRGLYQAGCWPLLTRSQFTRAAASYHRPFRHCRGQPSAACRRAGDRQRHHSGAPRHPASRVGVVHPALDDGAAHLGWAAVPLRTCPRLGRRFMAACTALVSQGLPLDAARQVRGDAVPAGGLWGLGAPLDGQPRRVAQPGPALPTKSAG